MGNLTYICKMATSVYEQMVTDRNSVVILTGAGASVSAGASLWEDIKKDLFNDLFNISDTRLVEKFLFEKIATVKGLMDYVLLEDEFQFADEIVKVIPNIAVGKQPYIPPELILALYEKFYGKLELQNFLSKHLYDKTKMSLFYQALLKLSEVGLLRWYITLNHDDLFNRFVGSQLKPIEYTSVVSKEDFIHINCELEENRYFERKRILYVALHGLYYKPESLELNPRTLIHKIEKGNPKYQLIQKALSKAKILLVIGYRAKDVDVWGALQEILNEQRNLEIYWVSPNRKEKKEISSQINSNNKFFPINSTADEFLEIVANLSEKLSFTTRRIISCHKQPETGSHSRGNILDVNLPCKENHSQAFSGPGSVIIAGDYGVYINGKMVQLKLPLRCYVFLNQGNNNDVYSSYDPYFGTWREESIKEIKQVREMLRELIQGNYDAWRNKKVQTHKTQEITIFPNNVFPNEIEAMFDNIRAFLLEFNILKRLENNSIVAYSQFPPNSGFGDTIPYVILSALILTDKEECINKKEICVEEISDISCFEIIIQLSKLYAWRYTYANLSHLRILSTFWNKSSMFILDRTDQEKIAFSMLGYQKVEDINTKEFMQMNLIIDTYKILEKGKPIPLKNKKEIDFALCYYPRRVILAKKLEAKTSTASGVYEINFEKDILNLQRLSNLTEILIKTLFSEGTIDYDKIGKILTEIHFGLVVLSRGSRLVNKFLGELNGIHGIYGSKTSGGGPGGALLFAYNPHEFEHNNVKYREIVKILDNFNHQLLLQGVLK